MSQILFRWLWLLLLELVLIEELLLLRLLLKLSLKLLLARLLLELLLRLLLELLLLDWLSSPWIKVWPLVIGHWLRLSELWCWLLLELLLLLLLCELSRVESVEVGARLASWNLLES